MVQTLRKKNKLKHQTSVFPVQNRELAKEIIDQLINFFNHGRFDKAYRKANKLVKKYPNSSIIWEFYGASASQTGRLSEAIKAFTRVTQLKPKCADGFNNLGAMLSNNGDFKEALEAFKVAKEIKPDYAGVYFNMGNAYRSLNKFHKAINAYKTCLNFDPNFIDAYNNIGIVFKSIGETDKALKAFKEALSVKPDYVESYNNIGLILKNRGDLKTALEFFEKALTINAHYTDAYNNMGNTLVDLGCLDQAIDVYKRALVFKPNSTHSLNNLGVCFFHQGKLDEALLAYEKALSIKPDYPEALNNLGNVLRDKGCFEKAFKAYDRALSFAIGYAEAYSNKLYCAASTFSVSSEKYLSLARGFNKITALKIEKKQFPKRHNVIKTKLRIGFVSGDFKDHPVGYFCENLIKNLDSKIFETFAFSNSNIITEQTSVLKSHMEGWHSIYGVSDDIVAELIHDQKLDVLIDLSGHTAKNRLPLFAYRPAPLQVTWLGFYASTGLDEMDYILGDRFVTPLNERKNFSEKILNFPDSYICFSPPKLNLEIVSTPALENGFVTFGCFNKASKISQDLVGTWSKILNGVPESKIFFQGEGYSGEKGAIITQLFADNGIEPSRISLSGRRSREEMLTSYRQVDIALDTFPYPGGTTTCEALWMGVPTITKKGTNFLSRVGESIAHNSDHSEMCSLDENGYIIKAIELSNNREILNINRLSRREKIIKSPLFDGKLFAQNFEKLIKKIL